MRYVEVQALRKPYTKNSSDRKIRENLRAVAGGGGGRPKNYLNASIPKDYKMGYYSKITLHVRFSLDVISLHVIFSRMLQLFETEKASIALAGHEIFAHFAAFSRGKSKNCLVWARYIRACCSFLARKLQGLPRLDRICSRILQLFRAEKTRIASSGHEMRHDIFEF